VLKRNDPCQNIIDWASLVIQLNKDSSSDRQSNNYYYSDLVTRVAKGLASSAPYRKALRAGCAHSFTLVDRFYVVPVEESGADADTKDAPPGSKYVFMALVNCVNPDTQITEMLNCVNGCQGAVASVNMKLFLTNGESKREKHTHTYIHSLIHSISKAGLL
jgi:hypothetical protein